jgi:hypothetical protein
MFQLPQRPTAQMINNTLSRKKHQKQNPLQETKLLFPSPPVTGSKSDHVGWGNMDYLYN